MTIQQLYNWARENNVEEYNIAYFDEEMRYCPSQSDLVIEPQRLEVIL